MNFKYFTAEELVGKTVLLEYGQSYADSLSKAICKISKVTSTGFRIDKSGYKDSLFDFNGNKRGLHGKQNMATICRCELITDEEADILRKEWKIKRE